MPFFTTALTPTKAHSLMQSAGLPYISHQLQWLPWLQYHTSIDRDGWRCCEPSQHNGSFLQGTSPKTTPLLAFFFLFFFPLHGGRTLKDSLQTPHYEVAACRHRPNSPSLHCVPRSAGPRHLWLGTIADLQCFLSHNLISFAHRSSLGSTHNLWEKHMSFHPPRMC